MFNGPPSLIENKPSTWSKSALVSNTPAIGVLREVLEEG
jgi:hypothetical protein